jgi:nitrate reductase assembly molybdenum cofactor insertion protein NarJ
MEILRSTLMAPLLFCVTHTWQSNESCVRHKPDMPPRIWTSTSGAKSCAAALLDFDEHRGVVIFVCEGGKRKKCRFDELVQSDQRRIREALGRATDSQDTARFSVLVRTESRVGNDAGNGTQPVEGTRPHDRLALDAQAIKRLEDLIAETEKQHTDQVKLAIEDRATTKSGKLSAAYSALFERSNQGDPLLNELDIVVADASLSLAWARLKTDLAAAIQHQERAQRSLGRIDITNLSENMQVAYYDLLDMDRAVTLTLMQNLQHQNARPPEIIPPKSKQPCVPSCPPTGMVKTHPRGTISACGCRCGRTHITPFVIRPCLQPRRTWCPIAD